MAQLVETLVMQPNNLILITGTHAKLEKEQTAHNYPLTFTHTE